MTTTTNLRDVKRLRDLKVGVRDLIILKPQDIQIEDGHNPRDYTMMENRQHLDELKLSIRENGVLQPLLVRYDPHTKRAILVDGECRLRACLELMTDGLALEGVPVVQVQAGNEAERLVLALSANTGKPLSKWESGLAFIRLHRLGWEHDVISKRLGFNLRFVEEAIELADAPQEIKNLLSEQAVTPSLALQQMRQNGAGAVEKLKSLVAEARADGKKIATKKQDNPVPNPARMLKLIVELVAGVQDDMFNEEFRYIEVPRATMVKLAAFVGVKQKKEELAS